MARHLSRLLVLAVLGIASLVPVIGAAAAPVDGARSATQDNPCLQLSERAEERIFPETGGWSARGTFLNYWELMGGLEIFGYPLTAQIEEDGAVVQFFERAVLECHELGDGSLQMIGGLLGVSSAEQRGLFETPAFQPAEPLASDDCTFFEETGHNLCGGFRAYWETFGGLRIYGFPISEEFVDPDTGLTVQYFERQRFERHPGERPDRFDVMLGRLGVEYLQTHIKPADAPTPASGTCGEMPGEVISFTINPDIPGPRCLIVTSEQRLRIVNESGERIIAGLSNFVFDLEAGEEITLDQSLGDFLAPGVHRVAVSLYQGSGPEIWLGGPDEG